MMGVSRVVIRLKERERDVKHSHSVIKHAEAIFALDLWRVLFSPVTFGMTSLTSHVSSDWLVDKIIKFHSRDKIYVPKYNVSEKTKSGGFLFPLK